MLESVGGLAETNQENTKARQETAAEDTKEYPTNNFGSSAGGLVAAHASRGASELAITDRDHLVLTIFANLVGHARVGDALISRALHEACLGGRQANTLEGALATALRNGHLCLHTVGINAESIASVLDLGLIVVIVAITAVTVVVVATIVVAVVVPVVPS